MEKELIQNSVQSVNVRVFSRFLFKQKDQAHIDNKENNHRLGFREKTRLQLYNITKYLPNSIENRVNLKKKDFYFISQTCVAVYIFNLKSIVFVCLHRLIVIQKDTTINTS